MNIETINDAIYYIYKRFINSSLTYEDLEVSLKTHGQGSVRDSYQLLLQALLNKMDDAYTLTYGLMMFSKNPHEKIQKLDEIHKKIKPLNMCKRNKKEVEEFLKYHKVKDSDILIACVELYKNYVE